MHTRTDLDFGSELRARRLEVGITLGELSDLVNYSKGHLSRIETGDKRASAALARRCDELLKAGGALLRAHRGSSAFRRRSAARPLQPAQLPAPTSNFTGRKGELAEIDRVLGTGGNQGDGGTPGHPRGPGRPRASTNVLVVDGMPGVGKTALALHWAHRAAGAFRDGNLYYDLRAHGPLGPPADPATVLAAFLYALGVDPGQVPGGLPERAALYRSLLAERSVLVVLDNATSVSQVRPLLPGVSRTRVVVTSRHKLLGLAARDGVRRLTLAPFTAGETARLLHSLTGHAAASPAGAETVDILGRHCGHLPLAVRAVAERALAGPPFTAERLAHELSAGGRPLTALATDDDEYTSVREAFSWSYQELPADLSVTFRLFAARAVTGLSVPAGAALLGVDEERAARRLHGLYRRNLLERPDPYTYRSHPLLAAYASELSELLDQRTGYRADERLLSWYRERETGQEDEPGRHSLVRLRRFPTSSLRGTPLASGAKVGRGPGRGDSRGSVAGSATV